MALAVQFLLIKRDFSTIKRYLYIQRKMDRFVNNNDFDKDVIFNKLAKISSELKEEKDKDAKERDKQREKELIYAQLIQGMKLNTFATNRNSYYGV